MEILSLVAPPNGRLDQFVIISHIFAINRLCWQQIDHQNATSRHQIKVSINTSTITKMPQPSQQYIQIILRLAVRPHWPLLSSPPYVFSTKYVGGGGGILVAMISINTSSATKMPQIGTKSFFSRQSMFFDLGSCCSCRWTRSCVPRSSSSFPFLFQPLEFLVLHDKVSLPPFFIGYLCGSLLW